MNCLNDQHRWAKTGLIAEPGVIVVPCLNPDCDAELWRRTTQSLVRGPGMTINGMRLDIEDDPDGGVAKVVCREAARDYKDPLPLGKGDVVLDIGAHVGIVSIYLAKRYPGIRVFAFEPVGENFIRAERNIRVNVAPGITIENKAVTADGRMVALTGNADTNSGGASIISAASYAPVASHSIADVFAMFEGRCKLLKIDCEGAEYEILEAAGDLLHRVDYLRGEFHVNAALEAQGKSIDGLIAFAQRYIPAERIQVTKCRMGD